MTFRVKDGISVNGTQFVDTSTNVRALSANITSSADASGTNTGALQVTGGGSLGGSLYVAGVVTATSFVGAFAGTVSGTATSANNLTGGTAGQFPYQTAPGTTSFISTGSMYVASAVTAEKWRTSRTITLGGDLSGSVTLDGSQDVTLNATVSGDTVALGTDTTGNYVATASAGTGIVVAGSGSETANITITNVGVTQLTPGTGIATNGSTGSLTLTNVGVTGLTGGGGVTVSASTGSITLGFTTSTLVTTASNLAGGTAGQLHYQSAAGTTAFTGPGTAGQVLVSNGTSAPAYQNTLTLAGNAAASSTTTGALQVVGGIGVGGNIYVGGVVTATSFVGAFAGTVSGNADTASKWATPRTFTFGGDLSGSMVVDGSQNVTFTATIAADSVVLGTDTTGNYVATATAGSGISVAGSGSETAAITITNLGVTSLAGTAPIAVSASTGSVTLSLTTASTYVANAVNAEKWLTSRTVTFAGGDVTGSFSIDGSANVSNVALTIGADSVALGTDTTGNYVAAGATSGYGLSGSSSSEGGTFTVASNGTSSNTVSTLVFRDGNGDFSARSVTLTGDLVVQGTTFTVNSTVTNVSDPIFTIGGGAAGAAPSADDNKDRGVAFQWHNGTAAKIGFFGYDDSTGFMTFVPDATITNEVVSGTKGSLDVNLAGGTTGQLVYQSAANTTAFAGPGTAGQILVSGGAGAPVYTNTGSIYVNRAVTADSATGSAGSVANALTIGSGLSGGSFNGSSAVTITNLGVTSLAGTAPIAVSASTGSVTVSLTTASTYVANATKVDTIAQTANANYFVTFVDSNNATSTQEVVGTTSTLTINPATGAVGGTSLTLSGATVSSSTTTGALVVAGGLGVGGNLNVGGTVTVGSGAASVSSTGDLTLTATGGNVTTTNIVVISNTSGVTSAATGALRVAGGVGVGGGLYVGGVVTATSFVGAFAGSVTGNADTASKWATPRTFTFGGDLSGSMVVDGSQNVTFTATIAADSIALGTDTTGNYVATATAGTGIAVAGSGAETAAITITNLGVTQLTPGTGIATNGSTGSLTLTNVGVTGLTAGGGVTVSASTGSVTLGFTTSTLVTTASNLAGGTAGQFHYQSAPGTTAFVSTGSMYVNRAVTADSASGSAGSVANALTIGSGLSGGSFNGSSAVTITNLGVTSLAGTAPIAVSASTGSVTVSLTTASTYVANAVNAEKWLTARTITLGGDLTGSVSIDGSAGVTLNATIAADSVALGTDTTGNYVAGVSAGTAIAVSGSGAENATVTITNLGVGSLTGGGGVTVSASTGSVTLGFTTSTLVTTASNLAGGTAGQLHYQSAPGTTAFVGAGTAGQLLMSAGAAVPVYTSTSSIYVNRAVTADNLVGGSSISGNLTITGNLVVQGTTVTVDSTVTNIADPIITIGGGAAGAAPASNDSKDRGIAFQWHNGTVAKVGFFGYDNSAGFMTFVPDATITSEVVSGTKGALDIHLAGGTTGQLHYQSAANTTAFVGPGTAGQILVSGGASAPVYTSTSSIYVNRAVTADSVATLTIGTGLGGTSYNGSAAVTITNTGVTSNVAGTGISVSGATGAVTITNSGVTSAIAGTGISVSGATGGVTITNSGVTSLTGGGGVTVSAGTGGVTLGFTTSTLVTTASNLAGGTAGQFHYQSAPGVTAFISTGSMYVNRAVTADNGGVTSNVAGTGVSVSGATGAVTISIGQAVATSSNVQFNSLGVGTAGSAVAGEIRATNEITAYYSDRRLKENVKVIDNAVTKVLSLNGITYTPNELAESFGYDRNVKLVGLFADEVEAILPEATRPAPFDQDENGNSKSGENYKTIQYEKLVPLLIEAIKEQQQQIAQLYDIINNTTNK